MSRPCFAIPFVKLMEKPNNWEQKILVQELTLGKKLAKQLKHHFNPESHETCESLVERILSSYDNALSLLKLGAPIDHDAFPMLRTSNSPKRSNPHSDSFDQCCHLNKKRKTTASWTEQVRISSEEGHEGSLDDGYTWRKYGQKDILGANFPRAYYRCSHRNTQGCLATKQVQRSGEDPSIFEVTYRGRHTCVQASQSASQPLASLEKQKKNPCRPQMIIQKQPNEVSFDIDRFIKDEITNGGLSREEIFPTFSFPPMPLETEKAEPQFFYEPVYGKDLDFEVGKISSLSPLQMNKIELNFHLQNSECSFVETVPISISVKNSTIGEFDFSVDPHADFDDFTFDTPQIMA